MDGVALQLLEFLRRSQLAKKDCRLWFSFALVLTVSFTILGWIGTRIYEEAPPIANTVMTTENKVVIESNDIQAGQNVWQSLGGMEVGSIWGHGSYVAQQIRCLRVPGDTIFWERSPS